MYSYLVDALSVDASSVPASRPVAGRLPVAGVPGPRRPEARPEDLHPALWRAHQVGRQATATWPTGFAALDAELPGGGWPTRVLSELLLAHPGVGEIRLLAPALVAVQQSQRCVMLFDPPARLCGWALAALGLDARQLVLVRGRPAGLATGRDGLWALEQALKSGHVGAVLAWLPRCLRADALRRLQLAAQAHDGPVFLLREAAAQRQPSAAPLRLQLAAAGPDELAVRLFKRRGAPLAAPLQLALAPVLSAPVRARALRLAAGTGGPQRQSADIGLAAVPL